VASPQFVGPLTNIGLEPSYLPAAEFAKFWDQDVKRSEETIRRSARWADDRDISGQSVVTLRSDHIAGGFFVAFALAVFAMSATCRSARCRRRVPA